MEVVDAVGAAVLAGCLLVVGLVARRWWLHRRVGCVDMSLRLGGGRGARGWGMGLTRLSDTRLEWWRLFTLAVRPRRRLRRTTLVVRSRRRPTGGETLSVPPGAVVVCCDSDLGPVELAVAEAALPGLLAWLESAPPGANLPQVAGG